MAMVPCAFRCDTDALRVSTYISCNMIWCSKEGSAVLYACKPRLERIAAGRMMPLSISYALLHFGS